MYFTATINCLAEYFISTTPKKNAYVVYQGRKTDVFKNWSDVVAQIENFKNPFFEGFNEIPQALEATRRRLGMSYFIDPNVLNDFIDPNVLNDFIDPNVLNDSSIS